MPAPGVPPFLYTLVGVVVTSAVNQDAAVAHPLGQVFVGSRVEGLHIRVSHQQYLHVVPRFGVAYVFQMGDADRNAPFQQGERQSVEVRQLWVVVVVEVGRTALEHQ